MSKETTLELVNDILAMVGGTQVNTIVGLTGGTLADIVLRRINRAIKRIAGKPEVDWYSLFKSRLFKTKGLTSSTLTITPGSPDEITDSASGLGSFDPGAELAISSAGNSQYRFVIASVSAGTITLTSSSIVTGLSSGTSVTITQVSYPLASDFRNSIDIIDPVNNRVLKERYTKSIDIERRWANNVTGDPDMFTIAGNFYRLSWVPTSDLVLLDRYIKTPDKRTLDAQTSDLPEFCDTSIYYLSYSDVLFFKKNLEQGAAEYNKFRAEIVAAEESNAKVMEIENAIEMNPEKTFGETRLSSGDILTVEEG